MITQYEWEGTIYFPNDTVARVKKGIGHILVPRGVSGTGGGSGGGSGGSSGGSPINPIASFAINPVNSTVPITPPVITPPPTSGGGVTTNPVPVTPYPLTAPNGSPIYGTYQTFTVAHNGRNITVNVPVSAGYRLNQTATGWEIANIQGQVIWSIP